MVSVFNALILTVDYSISPRDLCLVVIEIVQHRSGKLDFLSWAWGNPAQDTSILSNQHDIPRWVPTSPENEVCSLNSLCQLISPQRLIWDTSYHAAGETNQKVKFSHEKGNANFRARGIRVTEINSVGSLANFDQGDTVWSEDWTAIGGFNDMRACYKQ
jgi:hypothetical protein